MLKPALLIPMARFLAMESSLFFPPFLFFILLDFVRLRSPLEEDLTSPTDSTEANRLMEVVAAQISLAMGGDS